MYREFGRYQFEINFSSYLAEVSRLCGKEIVDGTRISGFVFDFYSDGLSAKDAALEISSEI